jgi:hypothetical protein
MLVVTDENLLGDGVSDGTLGPVDKFGGLRRGEQLRGGDGQHVI